MGYDARHAADDACRTAGGGNCGCVFTDVACSSKDHSCQPVNGQTYKQCWASAKVTATGTCQPNTPRFSMVPGRILPTIGLRVISSDEVEISWLPDGCNSAIDYGIYV